MNNIPSSNLNTERFRSIFSSICRDRLSASDMMIVRKVIEYIYDRYILNEQQQQQQQQQQQTQQTTMNQPILSATNGLSEFPRLDQD